MAERAAQLPAPDPFRVLIVGAPLARMLAPLTEKQEHEFATVVHLHNVPALLAAGRANVLVCEVSSTEDCERLGAWLREARTKPTVFAIIDRVDTPLRESLHALGVSDFFCPPLDVVEFSRRLELYRRLRMHESESAKLIAKLEKEKRILSKYFSNDLVEQLLSEEISANFGGNRLHATILVFDLRGSTTIAERLDPLVFSNLLNELFTDIMDLVYGNHGSVNKLLGDGMLATFGCPIATNDDAFNAVRTALAINEYLKTFNDVRPDYLEEPIRCGMGVASGELFAGNIGSVRRTEYTVIGDVVNTAARLESMTKELGAPILLDEETCRLLGDRIEAVKMREVPIRGKQNPISIYSVERLNLSDE